jgi:hypothetical protein
MLDFIFCWVILEDCVPLYHDFSTVRIARKTSIILVPHIVDVEVGGDGREEAG